MSPSANRSRMTLAATALSLVAAVTVLTAPPALAVPSTAACAQVEVTTIRGQGEPLGTPGYVLGPMVTALQNQLSQTVSSYPLPYDAGQDLVASTNRGIQLLTDHLVAMRRSCPNTRFVVLGFSLGALVGGETFAPATRYPGVTTYPLPTTIDAKVAAVVVFGDGRFNSGTPQNYGTYTAGVSGQYPRPANGFARFGDHVRDVCNVNDGVCQAISSSQADPQAHQDYVKYTQDLVGYVAYQLSVTR